MKNIGFLLLCIFTSLLFSCNNGGETPTEKLQQAVDNNTLAPGTIVAADSMPVVEDKLNDFVFAVRVIAGKKVNKGHYDIEAAYGHNIAQSSFVMPKHDYPLIPVLKRTGEPYTYIIGFYTKDDTTFYDYYQVRAERGTILMIYTKGYRFQ
jgi:hypothetical protein